MEKPRPLSVAAEYAFTGGQAIIDSFRNIQLAQVGGTTGANPPAWSEVANATTLDASVTWSNNRSLLWQSGNYARGQIVIDSNGNLQVAQNAGASGNAPPDGSLARSAWESVPRKNRPVGYGMIGRS